MSREDVLKIYDAVVSANPNFERKGKTMPYTSANGHMFSQVNKANELGIRLSKEDQEEFDKRYGTKPFISYGATMKDYVLIPEGLLSNQKVLGEYLQKGFEYVMGLPSK